jgi:hypothetical protein
MEGLGVILAVVAGAGLAYVIVKKAQPAPKEESLFGQAGSFLGNALGSFTSWTGSSGDTSGAPDAEANGDPAGASNRNAKAISTRHLDLGGSDLAAPMGAQSFVPRLDRRSVSPFV